MVNKDYLAQKALLAKLDKGELQLADVQAKTRDLSIDLSTVALGRVAQIILETAERGCLSRSTFDNPKTRGISCTHLAILVAAGGTPALRSIWATRPLAKAEAELAKLN
jgi:hypothetical protein